MGSCGSRVVKHDAHVEVCRRRGVDPVEEAAELLPASPARASQSGIATRVEPGRPQADPRTKYQPPSYARRVWA